MRNHEQRQKAREEWFSDLEAPRRYLALVNNGLDVVSPDALRDLPAGSQWRLMGTHETEAHAAKRVGW